MSSIGPKDILGVPRLPPGVAARAVTRWRAALARLHRFTAPPPLRILEAVMGSLDLAALAALCRLDIPDRLAGSVSVAHLAAAGDLDEARLTRLLRYAASRGWLRMDRRGRVRANAVTMFLRRDHPGGWRAWVEFAAGAEVTGALAELDVSMRPRGDAFEAANGAAFFDWMAAHPERHERFDAAMEAGARMHGLILAQALDWSSSRRVCDIGGGTGALLTVLLSAHLHLEGVLLDLPTVVGRARAHPRMVAVPGDAFDAIPPGCDTYLLVNVVHDWDDDAVITLLRQAARALAGASAGDVDVRRVVIVENDFDAAPRDDMATRSDLLMLALSSGGGERTAGSLARLASEAGLQISRSLALASGDTAHVLTPVAVLDAQAT